MRKGLWKEVPTKRRHTETKTGGGIHTGLPPQEIPAGMATDMENLHSGVYPHLSPRPSRSTGIVGKLPTGEVRYFGRIFGTTLAAVVGRSLYIWKSGAWKSAGVLFTASTGKVYEADFMDFAVFADGNECKKYNGETISAVGQKGNPENARFLATHAWHLFTASDKDKYLRYCAVENIQDWSAPGDAGQELVETTKEAYAGGLVSYGGHIIYFKKNAMFELYGTDPVNFSLLCLSRDIGCVSQNSIVEIGGILYFAGADGIYRYSGGKLPAKISFPIQKYMEAVDAGRAEEIAAGSDGERYYLVLPQKDGTSCVLAYDTRVGEWYREDSVPLVSFAAWEGVLYGAAADGTVYAFGQGTEKVRWYRVSPPYTSGTSLHQNWHRIYIQSQMEEGAYFTVSLSPWAAGEGFRTLATVREGGQAVLDVPPRMQDAPQMRIKIEGEGNVVISAIEFQLRERKRSYI